MAKMFHVPTVPFGPWCIQFFFHSFRHVVKDADAEVVEIRIQNEDGYEVPNELMWDELFLSNQRLWLSWYSGRYTNYMLNR